MPFLTTPETVEESRLQYAEMLAERLERLSTNPSWTHQTKSWASGIRKNVAIFRGEMPIPFETSLGQAGFFETQIKQAENILARAAREIGWGVK